MEHLFRFLVGLIALTAIAGGIAIIALVLTFAPRLAFLVASIVVVYGLGFLVLNGLESFRHENS